jgi:hypothetical protein
MPYGWPYFVIVLLQASIIPLVRDPALLPRIPRHPLLGLLPLVAIGGGVIFLGAVPSAVGAVTTLAAFAVPPLALFAAWHVRRAALPLAIVSPILWLIVWRLPTTGWTQLAGDLLIVLAAVSLGRLTGWIAPRAALVVGVLVATAVDIWQVLTVQVQPVALALGQAEPPRGLPGLQQLEMVGATMGWGDAYLAAVLGAVVAASGRATIAAVFGTLLGGLSLGLLFNVVEFVPATVPVAVGLLGAGLVQRQEIRHWLQCAVGRLRRQTT